MNINTKQPIVDFEGDDIKDSDGNLITIKQAISLSLNTPTTGEAQGTEQIPADVKSKIFETSIKLYSSEEPDFSVEELSLIKERAGKILQPLWYGRLCEVIDPKPTKEK